MKKPTTHPQDRQAAKADTPSLAKKPMKPDTMPALLTEQPFWLPADKMKIPVLPQTDIHITGDRLCKCLCWNDIRPLIEQNTHPYAVYFHNQREPYVTLDVDHGRDLSTGEPADWLKPLFTKLGIEWNASNGEPEDQLIEVSSSGTGYHLLFTGKTYCGFNKRSWYATSQRGKDAPKLEIIASNSLITWTGNLLPCSGQKAPPIQPLLEYLTDTYPDQHQPTLADKAEATSSNQPAAIPSWRGTAQKELTPEQIADMLDKLDPDCDHDEWKQIGMAVHDWNSGQTGKDLWQQWSQSGDKYDTSAQKAINSAWKSFRTGKGIGVGSLVKKAQNNGYQFPKRENNNRSIYKIDNAKEPIEINLDPPPINEQLNEQYIPDPKPPNDWPKLRLLSNILLPVEPITPGMLPEELRDWVQDETERMDNAPFEYGAVACLIALSSLVGRKITVSPKQNDDWQVVPNLWGCCVGVPSTKKSPVMDKMLKPLRKLEAKARTIFKSSMKDYEADCKLYKISEKEHESDIKKHLQAHKKSANKEKLSEAKKIAMDDSMMPEKPVMRQYIVHDATIEKLGVLLAENPRGLLQYRDELHGLIAGMDRTGHEQERAFWLEAFNGNGTFSYHRITREDLFIPSNTMSLLGGIQPSRIVPLLKTRKDGSGDDGLMERFQLMVYPDTHTFKHVDMKPDINAKEKAYRVFERLNKIPAPIIECEDDHEDIDYSDTIHFDNEAQAIFDDWYCLLMTRITSNDENTHINSCLAKYPSLMTSLALIFHLVKHDWSSRHNTPIDKESANMAIRWCEVLETHARRVYALVDNHMAGARSLLKNLNKLPIPIQVSRY